MTETSFAEKFMKKIIQSGEINEKKNTNYIHSHSFLMLNGSQLAYVN